VRPEGPLPNGRGFHEKATLCQRLFVLRLFSCLINSPCRRPAGGGGRRTAAGAGPAIPLPSRVSPRRGPGPVKAERQRAVRGALTGGRVATSCSRRGWQACLARAAPLCCPMAFCPGFPAPVSPCFHPHSFCSFCRRCLLGFSIARGAAISVTNCGLPVARLPTFCRDLAVTPTRRFRILRSKFHRFQNQW